MKKKLLSFLVTFFLALSLCSQTCPAASGQGNKKTEEKRICTATIDDNFEDDTVIVVLNKENSKFNQKRLPGYFDAETFSAAEDLTHFDKDIEDLEYLNKENFKQIFVLKLKKPGKKNVLKAIKKLEKKDYIYYAGPNYIYTLDDDTAFSGDTAAVKDATDETSPAAAPNDTNYNSQYGLQKISAPAAWNITTGSANVLVGV